MNIYICIYIYVYICIYIYEHTQTCININMCSKQHTSTNSLVNLKAEVSNPRFLPGEIDKIKPKSIWIKCPSASNNMLPLCLHTKYTIT